MAAKCKVKGKFAVGATGCQLAAWRAAMGDPTRQPATVETGATLIVGKTTVEFFTTDLKKIDLKPLLSAKKLKPRSHWYAKPAVGVARSSAPWQGCGAPAIDSAFIAALDARRPAPAAELAAAA